MTLVELLVALVIGLLIVMVAVAALTAARRGASTVDAASQLRDDARFASDLIQRLVVQTGFEDITASSAAYRTSVADYKLKEGVDILTLQPNIYGFNNGKAKVSDPLNSKTAYASNDLGVGSDVLILRYQSVLPYPEATAPDGSMISCHGFAPTLPPVSRDDRLASILYVDANQGEPSLMCIALKEDGTFTTPAPLLKGVESFQVLYGVDNVTAGVAPAATAPATSVPNSYLRADQLTVSGSEAATYANWRRVRSVRIGLVLRGPPGSAQETASADYYPLGGTEFASTADDPGSKLTAANDNRLRQVVTFTVQLRNCQNQGYQPATATSPCSVVMPSPS